MCGPYQVGMMTMKAGFDRDVEDRVAIVAEGGGMKGAYVMGVLAAMYQEFGLEKVDYVAGSSSGAPNLAYYAAGQVETARAVWADEITRPELASAEHVFRGHPFFDIDTVVDEVFNRGVELDLNGETVSSSLDIDAIRQSGTTMAIPVTNVDTGETEFLTPETYERFYDDLTEILRATMAEPYTYGGTVEIDGNYYFDGAVLDPIPIDAPGVKDCRKIIIRTRGRSQFEVLQELKWLIREKRNNMASNLFPGGKSEAIRRNTEMYEQRIREVRQLEQQGDVVIRPTGSVSYINNSVDSVTHSIRQGFMDALWNPALRSFLSALKGWERSDFYFRDD